MTLWTVIPRDPLIFRDGRPFNADSGARAKSLPYPFPSTLAGAARTSGAGQADFKSDALIQKLLSESLRGPLLVELDEKEEISEILFPAPADALLLKSENDPQKAHRIYLNPIELDETVATDLEGLHIVAPSKAKKGKPHRLAPRYWRKDFYEEWLIEPNNGEISLKELGHQGPSLESRMHVRIDEKTNTGVDGALFQTSGLEFVHRETEETEDFPQLSKSKKLALALKSDSNIQEGMFFLGGERRVAKWKKSAQDFPNCPVELKEKIMQTKTCRLILLTPAYFKQGYLPDFLQKKYGVEIVGAALSRHQVVSGWDYKKYRPKPTRKLVPAGSVYFLQINGDPQKLLDELWLQNISDGEQNRLDGFGLAILGSWDGELGKLEVNYE